MADHGHILRSGAADGADAAFEEGCRQHDGQCEIYLPWKGFNNHPSGWSNLSLRAYDMAVEHHPNWDALSSGASKMMVRNSYQVMGRDCRTPADLIICWTPGGRITGGTGQALRIAQGQSIPVINFGNLEFDEVRERIYEVIGQPE